MNLEELNALSDPIIDSPIVMDEQFQSEEFLDKALKYNARDEKLYRILISLSAAWETYNKSLNTFDKNEAYIKIKILESERTGLLSQLRN